MPKLPTRSLESSSTAALTEHISTARPQPSAATWPRSPSSATGRSDREGAALLAPTSAAPRSCATNLIDLKGLIYSTRRGYVDFTAPLFGDYIRRHHPLESLQ